VDGTLGDAFSLPSAIAADEDPSALGNRMLRFGSAWCEVLVEGSVCTSVKVTLAGKGSLWKKRETEVIAESQISGRRS